MNEQSWRNLKYALASVGKTVKDITLTEDEFAALLTKLELQYDKVDVKVGDVVYNGNPEAPQYLHEVMLCFNGNRETGAYYLVLEEGK